MMSADVTVTRRRDRVRAATISEIIGVARRLLISRGSAAVSLRAIAREMGMTAPAIYRYFDSHETLIRHVVADIFTDLSDHMEAAVRAGGRPQTPAPTAAAATDALKAACHAFRGWALAHPAEFGLIFGSPLPGVGMHHDDPGSDDPAAECAMRFGSIFLRLFTNLWQITQFDVPAESDLDPTMRAQLDRYRDVIGMAVPLGVLQTFLRCWVLLYGTVSLEVFGHLKFALDDASPMFELVLGNLASMLGQSDSAARSDDRRGRA